MYNKEKCFNEHCPHLDKEFNDNCGNYTFGVLEKMCHKYVAEATRAQDSSGSTELPGCVTDKQLFDCLVYLRKGLREALTPVWKSNPGVSEDAIIQAVKRCVKDVIGE